MKPRESDRYNLVIKINLVNSASLQFATYIVCFVKELFFMT